MKLWIAWIIPVVAVLGSIAPARAAEELNLFAWSEYVPQEVIDGFTKETSIKVNYETYASNEEMLSKVLNGGARYDLIQPSEYTVELMGKSGWIEALDWSQIPNIKNIGKEYLHLAHDPDQKYSVPWMTGTVGLCVNTDKVKEPIKGLKDVFQEKHKGASSRWPTAANWWRRSWILLAFPSTT